MEPARCPACGTPTGGADICPECGLNLTSSEPAPQPLARAGPLQAPRPEEQPRGGLGDAPPAAGTTEYAVRCGWIAALVALFVPAAALLAVAFGAIAIWRGRAGSGLSIVVVSAVLSAVGGTVWALVLS